MTVFSPAKDLPALDKAAMGGDSQTRVRLGHGNELSVGIL